MYRLIFFLICAVLVNASCKELFSPDIDIPKAPLVVDGLITDEAKPYSIKLSKALLYDNNVKGMYTAITRATVVVFDDCGHTYNFIEVGIPKGVYMSNPAEFVGIPGRSYTLSIKTNTDIEYRSAPQLLLPNNFTVQVDAEYGTRDQLVEDVYGKNVRQTLNGTNIFYTIENNEDTVIRFRFDHKTYEQYVDIAPNIEKKCWKILLNNDNINITDNYVTSTNSIEKHNVCFVPKMKDEYWLDNQGVGWNRYPLKHITKVNHYRLNNETYQFYKDNYKVLAATGKMFDPLPIQVKGNITCTSDKNIEALGFFEASSVRVHYYGLSNGSEIIHNLNSYNPPTDYGCLTVKDDWGWIWDW